MDAIVTLLSAVPIGASLGLAAVRIADLLVTPGFEAAAPDGWRLWPGALAGGALAISATALLPPAAWFPAAVLGPLLIAVGRLDLRDGTVHAALVLPMAGAGLLAAAAAPPSLAASLAGAALGYLVFRAVEWAFLRLRRREGLGRGDAWLLGAAGAWVGPGGLAPLILIAASLALAAVLTREGLRPPPDAAIPFAPALALATWIVWISGGGVPGWVPQ